ncbi:MAG: ATP-grasp domain-containing protein [Bacteroidetes bacterium]|nr:ATP-grasp domain-containing protein [Bacteroidota bacterium]
MKKKVINIAVTGLNATDNPGPGIPVIRGLREAKDFDVRIIGFAYESMEPGIYMHDLVDKTYQIPFPSAGQESLLARLEYIQEIEKIDVLIPNFDAELFAFMKLEKKLLKMGIHTFLPTVDQFEDRQKINLMEFGKKYDIKVPYARTIFSLSEIFGLTADFTYPVVVKGKYYDAYIAYNPEQVQTYFNKISSKWGVPIIIQQFVYGSEYNVIALGDGKGNTIGAVPMRKQFITDKGKAWAGITIDEKNLLEMTDRIISGSKWRGGMELELMKTQNNEFYLLEINPRIPAWVYLAVGAGQNMPEALVKLALGEEVKPFETYDVGKLFIRYSYDMIIELEEFEKISTLGEL